MNLYYIVIGISEDFFKIADCFRRRGDLLESYVYYFIIQ